MYLASSRVLIRMIGDKGSVFRLALDKMFLLVLCCIIINCDFLKGESYL